MMMPLAVNSEGQAQRSRSFARDVRFAATRRTAQKRMAGSIHSDRATGRETRIARTTTFGEPRATAPWLGEALKLVDEIDREAEEEGYPTIGELAKRNARRVLFMAGRSSIEPAVYASMDGEIAIYFKSRVAASALLILLNNEGGSGCYWSLAGKSEHERHNDASQLPEGVLLTHLRALGGLPLSQSVD